MSDTLTKRALFDLLRTRGLSAPEAALYPRVLPDMIREGIARKHPDGSVTLASQSTPPPALESNTVPAASMPTISARVTSADIAFLESVERTQGLTRADAIRFILERARTMGSRFLGSGRQVKAGV